MADSTFMYSSFHHDTSMTVLLREFVASARQHAAALSADVASEQWEEVRRRAHQLKGSGGSYGFPLLSQLAEKVEVGIRTHQPRSQFEPGLNELIAMLQNLAAP